LLLVIDGRFEGAREPGEDGFAGVAEAISVRISLPGTGTPVEKMGRRNSIGPAKIS